MNERPSSAMIDWDLAVRIGSRLAGDGPGVSRTEASAVVEELRTGAEKSSPLVRQFTGLVAQERTAPILVVDRPGWIQANADGFATVIAPIVTKLQEKKGSPSPMTEAIGSRVTGAELGVMLPYTPLHHLLFAAGARLLGVELGLTGPDLHGLRDVVDEQR